MDTTFFWKKDLFDSQILERNVAKIISVNYQTKSVIPLITRVVDDLQKNAIDYATYRFPAEKFALIHGLEKSGFLLVDCSVALEMTIPDIMEETSSKIREAAYSDIAQLQKLAKNSFYLNRFYNDPVVSKKQANNIYVQWITNSIVEKRADAVIVWEENKKICGFTTIKNDGNIVLLAVDPLYRGKGLAKYLVKKSLQQFKRWGVTKATIETQMTNIPALRAYQSCGFKLKETFVTYRWSKK